jgi:Single-strand binding protein family
MPSERTNRLSTAMIAAPPATTDRAASGQRSGVPCKQRRPHAFPAARRGSECQDGSTATGPMNPPRIRAGESAPPRIHPAALRPDQPEPPRHLAAARSPPPSTDHYAIGQPKNEGSTRSPPPIEGPLRVRNPRSPACPGTSSSKATSPATPPADTARAPARPTPTSTSPSLTAPRTPNGEWVDGPPTYYRVTVFGKTAENATNSLTKGNTVLVTGELTVRSYTRTDGTPGIAHEIIADHLGAALTHTTVTINPKNTAQTS